jgi:XTP/dITP diphosphohydrolase
MIRLVVATTNPDKLREIRHLLANAPVTPVSLRDFPPVAEPEETGATFPENARIKVLAYAAHTGALTVAEDSGLVVDALGGEPGVRSARFVTPEASYEERFAEIERRLALVPHLPRTARFVCAVAVARGGSVLYETTGTIEGEIAQAPQGTEGRATPCSTGSYRATCGGSEARKLATHRGRRSRRSRTGSSTRISQSTRSVEAHRYIFRKRTRRTAWSRPSNQMGAVPGRLDVCRRLTVDGLRSACRILASAGS